MYENTSKVRVSTEMLVDLGSDAPRGELAYRLRVGHLILPADDGGHEQQVETGLGRRCKPFVSR